MFLTLFAFTGDAPPIPPPTVYYQGDGKRARRKRRQTDALYTDLERTIRETLAGEPNVAAPLVAAPAQTVQSFDAALDALFENAQHYQDLSAKVAGLKRDLRAYELDQQRKRIEADDEETWLLM